MRLTLTIFFLSLFTAQAQPPMFKMLIKRQGSLLLDTYTGAAAAYSLRKLKTFYSGSAIRVRRSSDNTEQDIGFASGSLDTSALKTFVGTGGTDDGFVVTWYDQSDNSYNATQSTSSQQAKIMDNGVIYRQGGLPSILFDGSDDHYTFTNINAEDINWSLFSVVKRTSSGVTAPIISSQSTGPLFAQWSDNNIYLQRIVSGTDKYATVADATSDYCILSGFAITTGMSAYKNNTAYSLSSELDWSAGSTNFNAIGRYNTNRLNGYLSETILYMSDKTSDRTGIVGNINTYYTIY